MARPSKLTEEVQSKIIGALRVGNTRKASALSAGVTEATFYNWMAEGKEANEGALFEFFESVTRAEAECEVGHVAAIKKASNGHESVSVRTKTKTYDETVPGPGGKPLVDKDGNPLTRTITETETVETKQRIFDWHAAESWLKRRRRGDWGDSIDIRKLDDETILRLLADGEITPE